MEKKLTTKQGIGLFAAIIVFVGLLFYIMPMYTVYSNRLAGEAELARAESNRRIAIEEANAKRESAKALSEAEIIRAQGVAEANKIIGDSLKQNESYLRYLYIQSLSESETRGNKVIYIPTEAGLPILEAGRSNL
ncbi:MAG: hypothetical protein LBF37_02375 [Rickettsiales bacterium]|jgi:regulator of protease activity HflC (stomatin/prohibitin superfamily)|nr:hypothetical protein [Rickettsiales bacterium]